MYKNALVAKQQLEAAGFKIDLQVVDWATLVQRRNKPEAWDVFSTGITFNPEPAFSTAASCNWPGWWCHEDKEQWMDALARENDPRKRRAMWASLWSTAPCTGAYRGRGWKRPPRSTAFSATGPIWSG